MGKEKKIETELRKLHYELENEVARTRNETGKRQMELLGKIDELMQKWWQGNEYIHAHE